jgi:hypothetical protein
MVLINILTRTGRRERYYQTLKDSINLQSHQNIRHIKSNDNDKCLYLSEEEDVINVNRNPKLGKGFYNLYLNKLAKETKEGWVIILDDDSKLINTTFIEELSKICDESSEDEVIIYKVKIYKKRKVPNNKNFSKKKFKIADIDMACFCLHHSVFSNFKFPAIRGADYYFLDSIRKSNNYKFKYVDLPLGIWANYDGAKRGKDIC